MDYAETLRLLPETMPTDAITRLLQQTYAARVEGDLEGKQLQVEFLWELADKQWHNYAMLPTDVQHELDNFVIAMLVPPVSEVIAEALLGVILRLGLQRAFDTFSDKFIHQAGANLSEKFVHEFKELPEDISDPYRDLWEPGKGLGESDRSVGTAAPPPDPLLGSSEHRLSSRDDSYTSAK